MSNSGKVAAGDNNCMSATTSIAGSGSATGHGTSTSNAKPVSTQPCNRIACDTVYWTVPATWGPCSSECVDDKSGQSGVSAAVDVPVCMRWNGDASAAAVAVADAECVGAGKARPPVTKPCNQTPCPSTLRRWSTSPWGVCQQVSAGDQLGGGGSGSGDCDRLGSQQRDVVCMSAVGVAVDVRECQGGASSGGGVEDMPVAVRDCELDTSRCACVSDADCGYENSLCERSSGRARCVCQSGWGGPDCSIVVVETSSTGERCDGGVFDASGECCRGVVDGVSGVCCGVGATTDQDGRCCVSGVVDACGVCDGAGVAVDVVGVCCSTPLPPSGVCCVSGMIDSCGVCGGTNSCNASVSVTLSGSWVSLVGLSSVNASRVAGTLGVSVSAIVHFSVSSSSSSGSGGDGGGGGVGRVLGAARLTGGGAWIGGDHSRRAQVRLPSTDICGGCVSRRLLGPSC